MTTFFTRTVLWLLFVLCSYMVAGQENFLGYFEPSTSINYKVSNNYSHNWELSLRNYLYDQNVRLKGKQLDFTHFSKIKTGYDQSVALGVRYRFRNVFEKDAENELRFTQQFNFKHQRSSLRYGHRFRAEQRIRPSLTTHRFRYRLAIDLPLNGEKLDVGESYVIASTESLFSIARTKVPEYDQRFTANLGWLVTENTTLQTGIEYRFEDVTHATQYALFFLTSLIVSL